MSVTGATGFLGGAIARALLNQGNEVHALARAALDKDALFDLPVTWHKGDITVPETLEAFAADADAIIHSAGLLGKAGVPEHQYHRVNAEGVHNLTVAALKSAKRPRVVYISTAGVLGPSSVLPDETAPVAPSNAYERSKAAGEEFALEAAEKGLDVVIVRPGFLYGPGDRHVLGLFRAVERGHFFYIDGGRHLCHPTFIEDAVNGILHCLNCGRSGEIYQITGPAQATFREFTSAIAKAIGVTPPVLNLPRWMAFPAAAVLEALFVSVGKNPPITRSGVDFFSQSRTASSDKARVELGYAPRYDIAAGVKSTVDWYRKQGWIG